MSDGALRIPITGDASQFKATLAEIESSLKYFKEKLKSAKGDQVAKINFTIAGLEESKIALTTFGKFAEGTLGALNQQISELNRQKLNIKADAESLTPINQELDKLIKKRDELNKAGLGQPIVEAIKPAAESIAGLRLRIQELNDIKILIDPKVSPAALAKINQEIDGLEDKVDNLENLGGRVGSAGKTASKGLKNLEDQSRQSRIAVTNLALVLQDLPFGFIAIQNNLPNLQSSISNLKTTADGSKDAFKAFTGALVGPAGFFLAFSAVTGGITYAVQKYGSLGAALDRLVGNYVDLGEVTNNAIKSLQEYNKNLKTTSDLSNSAISSQSGQLIQVRALSAAVLDLSKSDDERKKALSRLKKLDEERFKRFSVEKGLIDGLKEATDAYTRSIIAEAVAQKFRDQVAQTSLELENQRLRLKDLIRQLDELQKKYPEVSKQAKNYLDLLSTPIVGQEGAVGEGVNVKKFLELTQAIKSAESDIVNVRTQLEDFNIAAFTATQTSSSLASAIEGTGDKAAPAAKKIKGLKEELQKVVPLFDLLGNVDATQKDELKLFDFDINKEFVEQFLSENDINKLKKIQAERIRKVLDLRKFKKENLDPNLPSAEPIFRPSAEYEADLLNQKKLAKEFEDTKLILEEVFFAPLSDLFANFFDTGKFAFEEFGKSILNTIKSLVSKILATGIINLLANILIPGGGIASAAFGGAATGAGGGILGAFGAALKSVLGIGKIANPNFGGVQGGGMQLAGEVVFRQRGSDLIGVINRTNGTINRVG